MQKVQGMTRESLVERLEALKPHVGEDGIGVVTAAYMDAIDDAIAVVRQHEADERSLPINGAAALPLVAVVASKRPVPRPVFAPLRKRQDVVEG